MFRFRFKLGLGLGLVKLSLGLGLASFVTLIHKFILIFVNGENMLYFFHVIKKEYEFL